MGFYGFLGFSMVFNIVQLFKMKPRQTLFMCYQQMFDHVNSISLTWTALKENKEMKLPR